MNQTTTKTPHCKAVRASGKPCHLAPKGRRNSRFAAFCGKHHNLGLQQTPRAS